MITSPSKHILLTPEMTPADKPFCLECNEIADLKVERLQPVPVLLGKASEIIVTCNKCSKSNTFVEVQLDFEGIPVPKFPLGNIVTTRGVIAEIPLLDTMKALLQYSQGDWGILCDEDKAANDAALRDGDRILAAYLDRNSTKFWIITEWDRSVTTLLLPEEY